MIVLWGVILVLITFAPRIYALMWKSEVHVISQKDAEVNERISAMSDLKIKTNKTSDKHSKYKRPVKKFDPNAYSSKDWQALGLSEKQAEIVLKFSKRGINNNSDLEKIYVFPKELLALIDDWTVYPDVQEPKTATKYFEEKKKEIIKRTIDINEASFDDLIELKGIGEYLANRIIEQRDKLGGFISIHQLKEIKYLDEEKFAVFEDQLICGTNEIKKININEASFDEIKAHPYIIYSIANSLVKMRKQKGRFETLDEIKESVLINEELFQKLKPYLSL